MVLNAIISQVLKEKSKNKDELNSCLLIDEIGGRL